MALLKQLKALNDADQSIKDIVNGYIRNCQSLLPSNKVYFNIPKLVYQFCLAFYYETEGFIKKCGRGIKISGVQNNIITNTLNGWNTAYGKFVIDSQVNKNVIYEWKFEIKELNVKSGSKICIGIESSYSQLNQYFFIGAGHRLTCKERYFYGMHSSGSRYAHNICDTSHSNRKLKTNDIVTMRLNILQNKLSFDVNDKECMIFKNVDLSQKYHIGICCCRENDSVQLLQFKCLNIRKK